MILKLGKLPGIISFVRSLSWWERRSYFRYFIWGPILNLRRFPKTAFTWQGYLSSLEVAMPRGSKSLDLGCGAIPRNPLGCEFFYGVDLRSDLEVENVRCANLILESIPFEGDLFDCVSAFDFIEHVPRLSLGVDGRSRQPLIELIDDIWRVLKPGGYFIHLTPACPGLLAYRDPTHVNLITDETFPLYFCGSKPWARMYGFKGKFELIGQVWIRDAWVFCVMRKVVD